MSTDQENQPKLKAAEPSNDLLQIVHVASKAIPDGLLLKEYQYRCDQSKPDGSQTNTDEMAALVLSWIKESYDGDLHGFDQFMSSASYINSAMAELRNVRDELIKAASDFVLKEFWSWFVEQDRSSFDIKLLSSWIDVHPSSEVRRFKSDIVQHLVKQVSELWNLTLNHQLPVDNDQLSKLPEAFRPVLKPLETKPETDKTESVTETIKS